MRELLGNAYSFPTIFKSVLSSTCVSLWLLILFFCLLKNVTRPCLTFWHLVRLKVLQVVTVGAHNRYTYIYFSLAQARNKMTEGMHGHAMIQRTNSFWNHQHTCNERKLGKAIAHFIVHNLFFFTGAFWNIPCAPFNRQHSKLLPQHPTYYWLLFKFHRVQIPIGERIHNRDVQWTYKTKYLWKDIFSCLPTCQKTQ